MASAGSIVVDLLARTGSFQTDMDRASKIAQRRAKEMESAFDRMAGKITGAFSGLLAGVTVAATATKLVEVQRQFDVLNASLVTVTGSSKGAATEFAWIKEFAAQTPFDLAQVTDAFIKASGLDASEAALRSYGNTASAMGKSLNQMIEAVADAATGEFERLKEFGIRAAKQGDQVTFTFRGVSKTIKSSSEEITQYLKNIGDNDFAGAMAERTKTLDGAISNLGDTWDELFRTINNAGVGALIFDATALATQGIQNLINNIKVLQQYAAPQGQMRVDSLVGERTGLQSQLADLEGRRGDVAATTRADLQRRIEKINAEVGRLQDEWIKNQNPLKIPEMPARPGTVGSAPKSKKGMTDAEREQQRVMQEGKQIYEKTRTAAESLSIEYERLNKLRDAGVISQDTYNRAVFDAQEQFDELINKTTGAAVEQDRLNQLISATPTAQLEAQRDTMMFLAQAFDMGRISAEQFNEAAQSALGTGGDSEGGYWEKWLAGAEEALTTFDELANNVIENFSAGFGNAFEAMVFDAENLGESLKGMAEGMARSVVNALGQMAAQWLAYQAVQMLVGKTTAASAAGAKTFEAMAAQQMAALNAFAATAAIPIIGPAMAPAAAGAALAATSPFVATVASLSAAAVGARADGGPVSQGMPYLIGERGPELFVPGTSGAVVPNNKIGGGNVTVNLIEDKRRAGQTQERDNNGARELDVFVADIMGDGPRSKAIRQAFGLQRRGY
jgi:hypothetical protein